MSKFIDHLDRQIIQCLNQNSRSSLSDIGKQIGISGPAVGERLKGLLNKDVIEGFGIRTNLITLGYHIEALVRIKPRSGQMLKVEALIEDQKQFTSCDRVTGEDCFIARLALRNIAELDEVMAPLHDYAETNTSIVKSRMIEPRLPVINI